MTKTLLPGFDASTRTKWTGSRAITLYDGDRHCRRCTHGLVVRIGPIVQDALFRFGGAGASERIEVDVCPSCGHSLVASKRTVRPPRWQKRLG